MTTEAMTAGAVLERLILSLLDNPREAELRPTLLPSRINWTLSVNIDDAGKVIGIKGAHARALQHLTGRMGDRFGQVWTLRILDPEEGPRGERRANTPPPVHFSPAADLNLLGTVLTAATGCVYTIDHRADGGAAWILRVTPADWAAQEALVDKQAADGEALIAVLGTLFRAVGRRQGVGYRVETAGGAL